jgi:ubiquinone/menaquinone biosynthesis C-methylase UbiE
MQLQGSRIPGRSDLAENSQEEIAVNNREVFERLDVVDEYAREHTLLPAEQIILDRYRQDYLQKRVLDLGVGGGRTAPALAAVAAEYVGVDFSESMVAACKRRFPQWNFRWADARDLSMFKQDSFDFVLFSYNGLDYGGDEDRRRVLGQVLRVLRTGGVFAFSSHNLEASAEATSWWRNVLRPRSPAELVRALRGSVRSLQNRRHNVKRQIRTETYAILNDQAHHFGLRTYYTTADAQCAQLRQAGFTGPVEIFGDDGLPLAASLSRRFLHYVVRKESPAAK